MPRFYQSFVAPLKPQTAPVPISDRHVAPPAGRSLPPRFAQGDTFTAPPKVIPAIVAAVTIAMWTPTPGVIAQPQEYAQSSYVAPAATVAAASLTTIAGWRGEVTVSGKVFRYSLPDGFSAPPKLFPPATITLNHWTPTIAAPAVAPAHAQGPSFVAPEKVLPYSFLTNWLGEVAGPAKRFVFLAGDIWTGPPTFAPFVSPFTLTSWLGEVASPAKRFTFSAGDIFTAPAKTLPPAAITISNWFGTDGAKAVAHVFAQGDMFTAPPKFGIAVPAVVLLPSWLGEVAPPAKRFTFSAGDIFTAPAKTLPPAAITLNHWMPNAAAVSLSSPHLQPAASTAPEKVLAQAVTPNLAWLRDMPAVRQTPRFAAADILTAPPQIPAVAGGPPTIGALAAAVRASMESLSAAVRPAIDAQFAAMRPAIHSQGAIVRPS